VRARWHEWCLRCTDEGRVYRTTMGLMVLGLGVHGADVAKIVWRLTRGPLPVTRDVITSAPYAAN
jgi:hypothetical protein